MRAGELARGVGQVLVAWPRFVAAPLYRRWHLRWGATDEVWPWLVQLGSGRAGWYSYDLFDNDGRPSADRILPQLQQIQVGDWVPMSGTVNETTAFKVNGFEPHRHGTLRRRGRRRVAIVAATVGVIAVSQWLGRTAGSTQAERRQPLPGDELIDHPTVVTNHAATIPVPPDQVWPWLVQMGWHRGGWYTPRFIDRDGAVASECWTNRRTPQDLEGAFVTYGLDVSLSKLRDPAAARARVPVTPAGRTR
jgi:hypothetical protein